MSVARFIADQRTFHRVPVAVCCAILGLSVGWFYKWVKEPVTASTRRRRELGEKVRESFDASGGVWVPKTSYSLVEPALGLRAEAWGDLQLCAFDFST